MKRRSKGSYSVKVTVGDAVVEIAGQESGVVKIMEALSDVLKGSRKSSVAPISALSSIISPSSSSSTSPPSSPPIQSKDAMDIRSFLETKSPSSDVEAAAVAAYYYQYLAPDEERQDYIDSSLLERAFRLGRRPLPARVIYTLQNARNAGYLDSIKDGRYKLNTVGYNLVEHALAGEGSSVPKSKPKKGKKPGKKKVRR